jgi:hypothetical protein
MNARLRAAIRVIGAGLFLAAPSASAPPAGECTKECAVWGSCEFVVSTCVATKPEHCAHSKACRERGWCDLNWDQSCVPKRPEHCARSRRCREWGRCDLDADQRCAPTGSDHCQKSALCRQAGRCRLSEDGRCAPGSSEDCARSDICRRLGRCALVGGTCAPEAEQQCLAAEVCRKDGMCRLLKDGDSPHCGALTEADCAATAVCKRQGKCQFAPLASQPVGRCIKARMVERKRIALTDARHGIRGSLALVTDAGLRAYDTEGPGDPAWTNDPENPDFKPVKYGADGTLAAASLRLLSERGEIKGNIALFPAATMETKDLGDETDTILITEHVDCEICWEKTILLQVRDGRVSRLRARDAKGVVRDVELSSGPGARWRIARDAATDRITAQRRSDPSTVAGPVTETRYRWAKGGWESVAREIPNPADADKPSERWWGTMSPYAASYW